MITAGVLVLDAPVRLPLRAALGEARSDRLRRVLLARTCAWGEALAPGRLAVLDERVDLAQAVRRAVTAGPLILVTTDVPRLGPEHAEGALGDLAEGADVVYGPALDGSWYLLGLRAEQPRMLAIAQEGADLLGSALALVHELGLEFGLLRHERRLGTVEDAAALLADPLIAPEVRDALVATR